MALLTLKKGSYAPLSPHFNSSEFECPCTSCTETLVDESLVQLLESLRDRVGSPLRINSGYRCQAYQDELRLRGYETATGISQHQLGRAADVMREDSSLSGAQLEVLARAVGFKAVGVGSVWVHVDLREDKDRVWYYTQR